MRTNDHTVAQPRETEPGQSDQGAASPRDTGNLGKGILAGAGVVGVAIGFGAQTLVKDLLSGVFIILEHRYALGDHVKIDIFEGEVVKITMRSTVLRNAEGQTFYISNGSIPKVINSSQDHLEASK